VPAAPGEIHLSGWLLSQRVLTGREARANGLGDDPLPSASDIERGTLALVETTVR